MKVLCVGSLNNDFVYSVNHIVQRGETILSTDFNKYAGGKGLNQAISLSKIVDSVFMFGYIGEDNKLLLDQLNNSNVNTKYVSQLSHPTVHAIIQVDRNGDNSIVVNPGANH